MAQDVRISDSRKAGKVTVMFQDTPVVIENDVVSVVEVPGETVVVVGPVQNTVTVSTVGVQGPPGPPGSGGGGTAAKFAATIGDGVATNYIINHALNMIDVEVEVFRVAAPFDRIYPEVQHTNANNITVVFAPVAPALNEFRVVVLG